MFTVAADKPLDDLVFHMLPTAVITGRVTDEDGDPMSCVRVIVKERIRAKRERELWAASTNDLGDTGLQGLSPGQYWVAAMPPPDFRDYEAAHEKRRSGPYPKASPIRAMLPPTIPALPTACRLRRSRSRPETRCRANFTLVPTRTYRVRGIVTGLSPGRTA